jgi:UDP-arabinose 4-epimerase
MKRVLVTGGAGYIGSHTCKALAMAGLEPIVYDDLSTGFERLVRWGPLVRGDISDPVALSAAMAHHKPIAVIHFAGRIAVGESVVAPWLHYVSNVAGTINLLNAMRQNDINHLVFSSSAAVYGVPESSPVKETATLEPLSPYGHSKCFAEQIIGDYCNASALKSVCLRYFNAAGADADGESGELHEPETHLIPLAFDAVLGARERLTVNGDEYDTPDGTCVRDYIHVTDLAQAHVAALNFCVRSDARVSAFNVGTGNGYSVREVLNAIEAATGRAVPHVLGSRRAGDPAHLVADASAANAQLGWSPEHSSLDEIIRSAWRWHQRERAPMHINTSASGAVRT